MKVLLKGGDAIPAPSTNLGSQCASYVKPSNKEQE